jgi:hypothetical protein
MTSSTRGPKAEITGVCGAVLKKISRLLASSQAVVAYLACSTLRLALVTLFRRQRPVQSLPDSIAA